MFDNITEKSFIYKPKYKNKKLQFSFVSQGNCINTNLCNKH